MLTAEDRRVVLEAARRVVADTAAGRRPQPLAAAGVLAMRAGAFVSLHRRGALRGCIGHVDADQPLAQVLCRCAAAAAAEDPRFDPVCEDELPDVAIEVSVLGRVERVTDLAEIEVGRHGLIVEQQWHKGLLLPQVATERGWNRETFLSQTCVKAGLPADAWKKGAAIFRFEADVFGEDPLHPA